MSLVNAVRINHPTGRTWVTDAGSIAAYGRVEEALTVNDEVSLEDVQRLGEAHMAGRTEPAESVEVTATPDSLVPGGDYELGDTMDVNGSEQRVVKWSRSLGETGFWGAAKPQFSSRADEKRLRADRAFQRLLDAQGGGSVNATAAPSKVDIELGAIKKFESLKWSWYDSADSGSRTVLDDPTTWHDEHITQVCRAAGILCTVDYDGATGWSHFELFKNGSEWNPLFEVVMDATPPLIPFAYIRLFGYEFLYPGDILTWRCTVNGQHRQGALSIDLVPAT